MKTAEIYGNIVVKRQDIIEVKLTSVPAQGDSYKLQISQNNFLNKPNVYIYGIEAMTSTELAVSPSGNTLIAAANLPYFILNLIRPNMSEQFTRSFPCTRLRPALYNGITEYFEPGAWDLDRSTVSLVGAGSLSQNQAICFNVFYKLAGE